MCCCRRTGLWLQVQSDSVMECTTGAGVGQNLLWQVEVEGLRSTTPASSYNAPVVTSVTSARYEEWARGSSSVFEGHSTLGGDTIIITGHNFGSLPFAITVTVSSDTSTAVLPCALVVPHTTISCNLTRGAGRIRSMIVTILEQQTAVPLSDTVFVYAAPTIVSMSPTNVSNNVNEELTLFGSGFGSSEWSSQVRVLVSASDSGGACDASRASSAFIALPAASVTVLSDGELLFRRPRFQFLVAALTVRVEVSGQVSHPWIANIQSPQQVSLSFDSKVPNGTHNFISISGTHLGTLSPTSSQCDGTVVLFADGALCDELVVLVPDQVFRCTTRKSQGKLVLRTVFSDVILDYSNRTLLLPPEISTVEPLVFSTTAPTRLRIVGQRFGESPLIVNSSASALLLRHVGLDLPLPCSPTCNFSQSGVYLPSTIDCVLSPGVGSEFDIQIRGIWVRLKSFGDAPSNHYAPPVVLSVKPSVVDMSGGTLSIVGTNFGSWPACGVTASLMLSTASTDPAVFNPALDTTGSVSVGFPPLQKVSVLCTSPVWSPTLVNCTVPFGIDATATVSVSVAGQSGSLLDAIRFTAPEILFLIGADDVPAIGGSEFIITGSSFPPPSSGFQVAVTVGAVLCECDLASRSSTSVRCISPPGSGEAPVLLHTASQRSASGPLLRYARPEIAGVSPPEDVGSRLVEGGFVITVLGSNFYPGRTYVSVASNPSCSSAPPDNCDNVVVDETSFVSLTCTAPAGCGNGTLFVTVTGMIDGVNRTVSAPFRYDGPYVTSVSNLTSNAVQPTVLKISGMNFGTSSQEMPDVSIGQ